MSHAAVRVQELVKRYGGRAVVDGLSLEVAPGEIFALLGPNGAGKTTTLEILEGLRTPDAGTVRVLDLAPGRDATELTGRVGVMLQEGGAPPGLTARETLGLFGAFYRQPHPADELLALVGLTDAARTHVRNLSGGQKQRLSLAMSLVGRPELVFLDEPTVGMDAAARRATWATVRRIARDGTTILLTTHHLDEAQQLADRVAIIHHGRLLALGTPEELVASAASGHIRFRTASAFDVEALAGVVGHAVTRDGDVYRIDVPADPARIATITAWLGEADVLLTELRVGAGSLEEAFLHLTGDVPDGTEEGHA